MRRRLHGAGLAIIQEADRMTVGANVRDPKVLALSLLAPCRLVLQLRKYRCNAADDATGHSTKSLRSSPLRGGNALDRPDRCAIVRQAACPNLRLRPPKI